jgi:NAD dependent epimerase/dehydratase family enzyme
MLTPFKLGLGGPIGSGRQFWPWIGIKDVCAIIEFILGHEEVEGPVNAVAPQEIRCSDFARTLGQVLSRPAFMPLPAFAARLALGEMADSLLLASQRVRPRVLEEAGHKFFSPTLGGAIRDALS